MRLELTSFRRKLTTSGLIRTSTALKTCALFLIVISGCQKTESPDRTKIQPETKVSQVSESPWHHDLEAALAEARESNRPLLIVSIVGNLAEKCWLAAHVMRVGTLEDEATLAFLSEHFVLAAHNQLPELYCTNHTINATAAKTIAYPSEQTDLVTEGVGGGNVRSLFCTSDGQVVNYISGFWKQETYLAEARWALEQMTKLDDEQLNNVEKNSELWQGTRFAHQESCDAYATLRDKFASPAEVEKLVTSFIEQPTAISDTQKNRRAMMFNKLAAFNRLIRSHREAQDLVGKPVKQVLQKIEDEVYTKGAIGCSEWPRRAG